jgi:hypothetical protein
MPSGEKENKRSEGKTETPDDIKSARARCIRLMRGPFLCGCTPAFDLSVVAQIFSGFFHLFFKLVR